MANSGGKGESAPAKVRRLAVHGGLVRPSVYVRRSKITISLEPSVWEAFQEIAAEQGKTVNQLAAEIEQRRIGNNLSAAIRVYRLLPDGDKRAADVRGISPEPAPPDNRVRRKGAAAG